MRISKGMKTHARIPIWFKDILLLAVGVSIFLFGCVLQLIHTKDIIWQLVQTFGVTIFSVWLALVIHRVFGGPPEIQEALASLIDLQLGQQTRAAGIAKIYDDRAGANGDMLEDLRNSQASCRMYAAVYLSQFVKNERLKAALLEAASRAHSRKKKYNISYCSFAPDEIEPNGSLLRIWAARENELDNSGVIKRIQKGSQIFEGLEKSIEAALGKGRTRITRRFFKNYLSPHSLLIIDDSIVYVSFYTWRHISGDSAPTLRLESGPWHKVFLEEASQIDEQFSVESEPSPTE